MLPSTVSAPPPIASAPRSCVSAPAPEVRERIVDAVLRAPSAENHLTYTPVWAGPLTLELRPTAAFEVLTPQLRFLADISAGAMVENARCMAAEAGFSVDLTWSTGPVRACLRLGPDGVADGLAHAIAERCTNRRPYARTPLPTALHERLLAAAGAIADVGATVLEASGAELFATAAATAEGARLRSRALHEEMFSGIRFDAGWTSSVDQGIPPGSLEVEWLARPGFAALRSWHLCRLLGPLGGAAGFGWRSGRFLVNHSAAILIIDCALAPEQAAPVVGQALQRIWLQATALGLAVQPMPAAALFALPWWEGVPTTARARLQDLWPRLLPGRTPLMALRIGYAPAPSLRAGRPIASRTASACRSPDALA